MRKKAIVLGCGLVGATMARDLAADDRLETTVVDVNAKNLDKLSPVPAIRVVQADLSTPERVKEAVADFDVVVGAMPSSLGFAAFRAVVESGKPYVDISFMIEDATSLDALAKEHGVTAVIDCGVAPGLANMIIGHCDAQLDVTENVVLYVGGLPKERHWPYEYKACFAPYDVLEEYTRPARLIEHGRLVVKPALSEPELIDFPHVGTLEAFNTDGLRSLIRTIKTPNMKEKTLRFPGHIALMRVLRETGFFGKEEIDVRGVRVRPLDVTSELLFPMWELEPGKEEFTVLRVIVEGRKGGKQLRHVYDLYDETDPRTGDTSMARTTGFPCVIVGRMLLEGRFAGRGVFPPELLGRQEGILDHVTRELSTRGVNLTKHVEENPDARTWQSPGL